MASWLEKGRPAIFEALNAVCDRIDADARAELHASAGAHHETLATELESLRKRVAAVDRLEEENRALRAQLLQAQQTPQPADAPEITPNTRVSIDRHGSVHATVKEGQGSASDDASTLGLTDPGRLKHYEEKCARLQKTIRALDENIKYVTAAYKSNKHEVKQWKHEALALKHRVKQLEQAAVRPQDSPTEPPDVGSGIPSIKPNKRRRASSHVSPTGTMEDPAAALSFSSDPGPDSEPRSAINVPAPVRLCSSRTASTTSAGSDSNGNELLHGAQVEGTGGADDVKLPPLPKTATADPGETVTVKQEASSDGPVFINERPVRKRKVSDHAQEPPPQGIKAECSESDSVGVSKAVRALGNEGLDLDEVGRRFNTPRKNRLLDNARLGLSAPAARATGHGKHVLVRPDPEGQTPSYRNAEPSALTPVSSNIRVNRRLTTNSVDRPLKRGLAEGVGSLAEDGSLYKRAVRRKARDVQPETPSAPGRLDKLLNAPTAEANPAIIRSSHLAPRSRDWSSNRASDSFGPQRRELPFEKKNREGLEENTPSRTSKDGDLTTSRAGSRDTNKMKTDDPTTPIEQDKPRTGTLRSKDPSTLRLNDFKVNPKSNGGSDYAYADVIRGKDKRACLSGCTDLSCCGKQFRDMAIIHARESDRTDASDRQLFEEYLGDNISRILDMSQDEREELWVEAKTWQLANKVGRHRHNYARQTTPPGFWNAEFPNTQEIQAEKAEAARREKQVIQDRYREAMRPGGRWLFRDEV